MTLSDAPTTVRIALCAALLAVAGCRTTRLAAIGEAETTLRSIETGYASTPDMSLEGTVRVSGIGATVWVDALVRGHDSLKITLTGPFAIPFGALSATRSRFEFYKADEDIVLVGAPDRRTFEKLLMIPLEYDELVALLRGEVPHVPAPGEYEAQAREGSLVYTTHRGERDEERIEEIVVDPTRQAVTAYRRFRRNGDTTAEELSITYSSFAPFGSRQLARRAAVDIAGGAQHIAVSLDRFDARLAEDASLALDVPEGTERREFRP
jgi:hypothetical protein